MTEAGRTRRLAALAGLAGLASLLVGACSPIEVDANNVEVTQHGVHFDAAPPVVANVVLSVSQSFELDSAKVTWAKDLNAEVHVTHIHLHAVSGVPNLDFIRAANLAMSDVSKSQAPITVASYQRSAGAGSSSDLEVGNPQPVDVTAAWSGDRVRIDVGVTGSLPTTAWTIDVTLSLTGQISYHL